MIMGCFSDKSIKNALQNLRNMINKVADGYKILLCGLMFKLELLIQL